MIIRVKNTAIGGVDTNFLEYPFAEKLFLPWTFGEIYIEEGLEDAMNINRNSFMITHPHYRKLKGYIRELLHNTVFTNCRERYSERQKNKTEGKNRERERFIKTHLKSEFGRNFKLDILEKERSKKPVELDVDKNHLIVYGSHPIFKKLRKRDRILVQDIVIAFESALKKSNNNVVKLRQNFLENLERLSYERKRTIS